MFDIDPETLNHKTDKLLYNIWQELKKLNEQEPEEPKPFQCKKCNFSTENKGLLLSHYRKIHPKKEE